MKVNSNAPLNAGIALDKTKEADKKQPADLKNPVGPLTSSNGSSTVEISERARLLQKANELVNQSPDGSSPEKLSNIKRSVREGTYKVDAGKVADRLVEEHLGSDFGKNRI